jgi:hypothetical protein
LAPTHDEGGTQAMSKATARRLALLAILTLALGGTTIGVAGATNTVEIDSEIVLRESFPAFHGKVKSSNAACTQNRRVKVFKKRRNGGRKLLGKSQTDLNGKWQVIVDPLSSGAYLAVVKKRSEGTAGTIFVCLRDRSQIVVVD